MLYIDNRDYWKVWKSMKLLLALNDSHNEFLQVKKYNYRWVRLSSTTHSHYRPPILMCSILQVLSLHLWCAFSMCCSTSLLPHHNGHLRICLRQGRTNCSCLEYMMILSLSHPMHKCHRNLWWKMLPHYTSPISNPTAVRDLRMDIR